MGRPDLSRRAAGEAIFTVGEDLAKLVMAFDALCNRIDMGTIAKINAVEGQEHLSTIAAGLTALGDSICAECDQADTMAEAA